MARWQPHIRREDTRTDHTRKRALEDFNVFVKNVTPLDTSADECVIKILTVEVDNRVYPLYENNRLWSVYRLRMLFKLLGFKVTEKYVTVKVLSSTNAND